MTPTAAEMKCRADAAQPCHSSQACTLRGVVVTGIVGKDVNTRHPRIERFKSLKQTDGRGGVDALGLDHGRRATNQRSKPRSPITSSSARAEELVIKVADIEKGHGRIECEPTRLRPMSSGC